MDNPATTPTPTSALAQWNAEVQRLLEMGYSTLNANEEVNRQHPGLWQAATAEHYRACCARGLTKPLA